MVAQRFFVDGDYGNDGQSGLTPALAKKTIYGALDAIADVANIKQINILGGTFNEGNLNLRTLCGDNGRNYIGLVGGPRKVIIDGGSGSLTQFINASSFASGLFLANLHFTGFGYSASGLFPSGSPALVNCSFHGGGYNPYPYGGGSSAVLFCSFHDCTLRLDGNSIWHANIDKGCSWSFNWPSSASLCASEQATLKTMPGCFDVATYPPPWVNEANGDLAFNPLHAQYGKYMAGGWLGGRIGASCRGMIFPLAAGVLDSRIQDHMGFANQWYGAWVNDERYWTGGGPGVDGPADAAEIKFTVTGIPYIDTAGTPGGKSGRIKSPVIDLGVAGSSLKSLGWPAAEQGTSVVDTSKLTSTRHMQIRAHTVTFAHDAVPGSTLIDWTDCIRNVEASAIAGIQHVQFRSVLRTDGTV